MRPFEAALKGSREIGFTIISITFSLIAVFIPVLLMGGIVGRVFREFAVTIAVAIILSGFVSLTLTPMLCARVLRAHHEGEKQFFVLRWFEAMFKGLLRGYEWALDRVLAYKSTMLLVTFATIIGTVLLYYYIPKGFFPIEDTGFIFGSVEGPSDISFQAMYERQQKIAAIVQADKAVDYVNSTVGVGGPNVANNQGRLFIALKPRDERKEKVLDVIQRLRRDANVVTGMRAVFAPVQNINITGRISKADWQYTLQSSDAEALYRFAPEMRERIEKIPGILDVSSDLYITNPTLAVEIDREMAAVYGISIDQVRQELFNAFGSRQVATIYTPSNDYQVILENKPEFQIDTTDLSRIYLKTNAAGAATTPGGGVNGVGVLSGTAIPLSAVAKLKPTVGPPAGQPPGSAAVGDHVLQPGARVFDRAGNRRHQPAWSRHEYAGVNQRWFSGRSSGLPGLPQRTGHPGAGGDLCRLRGARHPLREFHSPDHHHFRSAVGGCRRLLVLMVTGLDLSVIAMIGIVMLVGIVKKNAIMMIDFAIERRRVGLNAEAAIRDACLLRFRPIMMTTFAAIFGTLPIALGTGAGAELRQPLGIAVVGGLCVSQLLTLFITPVVYVYLDRIDRVLRRRLEPQLEAVPEPTRPAVAAE